MVHQRFIDLTHPQQGQDVIGNAAAKTGRGLSHLSRGRKGMMAIPGYNNNGTSKKPRLSGRARPGMHASRGGYP